MPIIHTHTHWRYYSPRRPWSRLQPCGQGLFCRRRCPGPASSPCPRCRCTSARASVCPWTCLACSAGGPGLCRCPRSPAAPCPSASSSAPSLPAIPPPSDASRTPLACRDFYSIMLSVRTICYLKKKNLKPIGKNTFYSGKSIYRLGKQILLLYASPTFFLLNTLTRLRNALDASCKRGSKHTLSALV